MQLDPPPPFETFIRSQGYVWNANTSWLKSSPGPAGVIGTELIETK